MKLSEMLEIAVKKGIENDPRGKGEIEKLLKRRREKYEKLSEEEKKFFDVESLTNPYSDTRIFLGDKDLEVKRILTGIDLEVGEVMLAEALSRNSKKIDALVSHHPEGSGLVNLHEVMYLQADVWHKFGVPINIGDSLIGKRAQEVYRRFLPFNHERTLDAAKLLGFAFMSIHTAADNCVTTFLQKKFDDEKPERVKDVIELLLSIPEYEHSKKLGAGPVVIVGSEERRAGKVMVDMTGGTEGPKEAVEKLAQAGVGTIVCMHMVDEIREVAEKNHVNVVIAGHIASDSIGLNLILDEFEKRGVDIVPCSGLIRVSRN
jgi:putative NIF3 family GTP cyclohydrolase 1 type 2